MIAIKKTTKLFINGEFPRTESGRSFVINFHNSDQVFAEVCQGSRKDLRNAVVAAGKAQPAWAKRTAYNRAQILYRMAEMLEGKRAECVNLLEKVLGRSSADATNEFDKAIEALVFYSGFADKYSQVMASVNPVSGPYHNFTTPEPVGVVGMIASENFNLASFIAQIAAVVCSGNSVVVIFEAPGAALLSELAEMFKTSDLPAGVINLISGYTDELASHMGQHMEIHSVLVAHQSSDLLADLNEMAIENMKRVVPWSFEDCDLAPIVAFTESKTIWHPVGI